MSKRTSYKGWTDEQLVLACKESYSIAQVLRTLGLIPAGGNYSTINRKIKELNIDTSHFTSQRWSKGKILGPRRPIEELLIFGRTQSDRLRRRLISSGLKEHRCERCGNTSWLDGPIPLELDHVDGVHDNNTIENLRLLCPNCHALTPTYRGKNIKARVV